jgi:DNA polymerase III epsilon subunit-like protein
VQDDVLKNKLLGIASSKDAKLSTAPSASSKKNTDDEIKKEDKPEKPSKAQSEYEQFLIDWEPSDPLPFFPPGKIIKLCHLSNNPMVTGSDYYIDNPETTKKPYKPNKKSIEEEFLEVKNLGPKLSRGLSSLLAMVARSRGLWVDDKNKLRCPEGTPAANQFTDITGSNCFIPSPSTAAQSGARAARRAFGTAEQMAAGMGQRVDRSPSGRSTAAARYSPSDLAMLQAGMDIGGRMAMLGGASPSLRQTRGTGAASKTGMPIYYIGKREAIARGKDLTRAAAELKRRYSPSAQASEAIVYPPGSKFAGQPIGDVRNKADFMRAMQEFMPNVDPNEFSEYFDNAIPGVLSITERRAYVGMFEAFWQATIQQMTEQPEAYKIITTFEMMDDINTAVEIQVDPFSPSPQSGGRLAGVGAIQMARQAGLMAEGGAHVRFKISPFGMWQQANNVGRNMDSDGSGWWDSREGRMHYIAVHETGHVVDFYQKLKAFGLDPNVMGTYTAPTRVVNVPGAGPSVQQDKYNGAWIIDWSQVSNPLNNPFIDDMIQAAARLKSTQYTGSRFSGRKIDLQDDMNAFYANLVWGFQNNINHSPDDLPLMAALVGGAYATEAGVETRAEYFVYRRLFGELRGAQSASPGFNPFRDQLQTGPFDATPSDIDLRTTSARKNQSNNLLTHFLDAWATQERQRALEPGGALYQIIQQLPPGQAIPQSIIEDFERNVAADTLGRLNKLGQDVFGVAPNQWNISGRMGNIQGPSSRPPSLHAQRVRTAVRSNNIRTTRGKKQPSVSYGISGRMGNPDPVKPQRPREPDNGPFTGKFLDVLRGSSTWKQFAKKYRDQEVVFFDYETTGFGDDGNMPVQIGAVKMKNGKVVERFNIFVNPGIPLGDWAKKNLKDDKGQPLTDEWLASKASLKESHEKLLEFFGEDALLGGQYTPFDLEVLERILGQVGLEYKPAGVIDSKAMADEILPRWTPENPDGPTMIDPKTGAKKGSNSLGPLAEYLEVDLGDGWHTADADSEASAMIIERMLDRAASRPDTPRRILDVDQVPLIVQERRAQYDRDMADYSKKKAEYDQLISGRMGASQFETANGSVYTRQQDGTFRRKKSAMLGTTIEDTDVESTFDNTMFVDADDAYLIMAQGQRGAIIDKDGDLVGRRYDDTDLDSAKFMSFRREGDDFDTAYRKAGGTVQEEKIPAVRISREPQTGLKPIEWNNKDNKFHVGSPVSSITMETSQQISGRMGNPQRASLAKTVQVKEMLASTKSSIGAAMSDEYIDSWPEIQSKLNQSEIIARKPLTKSEARQRTRSGIQWFAKALQDAIGGEGRDPQQTAVSPYLRGVELDFMAHIAEMSEDELEQEVIDAISEFHAGIDPRPHIQVWQGDLTRIIQNGYKTTHQVDSDHSNSPMRKVYEAEIGIHPDVPDTMRPASGYIVHTDWLNAEDKAAADLLQLVPGADPEVNFPEFTSRGTAETMRGPVHVYGGAEIILRPETSGRTFYGYGDSLRTRFTPASVESVDPDEVARSIIFGGTTPVENMLDLLHGKWTGDYSSRRYEANSPSKEYYEALVVGGFDAADIEEVIIPSPEVIPVEVLFESESLPGQRNEDRIARGYDRDATIPSFSKMKESQYWVDNAGVSAEDAEIIAREIANKKLLSVGSNVNLARLLAAEKIRKQLEAAGAKMTVRNDTGMDFFNPDSWIKGIKDKSIEDVAEARMRQRIMLLIKDQLAKATA